jgi:tRNA(adenine34) deaminase
VLGAAARLRVLTRAIVTETTESDEVWMQLALAQADAAALAGDVPIGAVVVSVDNQLVASGCNRREQDQDPTAHAEIVALRAAARVIGHWRIEQATLYVTLEPCTMCAGALVNARIARVVYGARDPKAGGIDSGFGIGRDDRLNHRFLTREGVLKDECVLRLQRFFARLRAQGQK